MSIMEQNRTYSHFYLTLSIIYRILQKKIARDRREQTAPAEEVE
jgi:hypothetical protein